MTPDEAAAQLGRVIDDLARLNQRRTVLLGLRAQAVRALVDAGVRPIDIPQVTGGRISRATVKADLRRLPKAS